MFFIGRKMISLFTIVLVMAGVTAKAQTKSHASVPGEFVVRLKIKVVSTDKEKLSKELGSYVKSIIPSQSIVVVKRPSFEDESTAIKTLSLNKLVDIAEPNYIYKAFKTPNDPMLGQLWGLKNIGQQDSETQTGVAGVDIDAEKAWDIETGSEKTIVAIIDTGIDFNHPDLKDNLWTNNAEANGVAGVDDDNNGVMDDVHGYNAITDDGNALDDQGHGSHCAGTIGAKGNDGKGIVGVNWNVKLMAVKFLGSDGSGSLEDALKAVDYATKMGAKVMSNSWGGGGFSQTLFDAIKRSNQAGAVFVAAAGNDGSSNDSNPAYPASYNIPNIISVAAINNKGELADFSNYGKKSVHVGAPGVNIYSSTGGTYDSWSGTSMATPHVSGVAALVWSHEPRLTALELKQRITQTVRPIAALRAKTSSRGLVNAYNALTNQTPAPDANDPNNWKAVSVNYASASPYKSNTDEKTKVSAPAGVKEWALYFEKFDTELNYDLLKIYDSTGKLIQTLSGRNEESFSTTLTGPYVTLAFTSDESVEKAGWSISKIAFR